MGVYSKVFTLVWREGFPWEVVFKPTGERGSQVKAERGLKEKNVPVRGRDCLKVPRGENGALRNCRLSKVAAVRLEMNLESLGRPLLGWKVTMCSLGTIIKTKQS